jgi:transcription elongation GreA/GreB family factor
MCYFVAKEDFMVKISGEDNAAERRVQVGDVVGVSYSDGRERKYRVRNNNTDDDPTMRQSLAEAMASRGVELVSLESPVGTAMIGRPVSEQAITVRTPKGTVEFTIDEISDLHIEHQE